MARIRSDLRGCVYVGMTPFFAGDTVPDGAVDPVFLEDTAGNVSATETIQVPPVELGEFDPSTASVRTVREHLAMRPEDTDRVLALERAGLARKSLIGGIDG